MVPTPEQAWGLGPKNGIDPLRQVPPEVTADTEIVLVGGQVDADSLVVAYSMGLFPMEVPVAEDAPDQVEGPTAILAWFSPDPRGVLRYPGVHVSRSLRRAIVRFDVSVDRDFEAVLDGCADPQREHGWIDDSYRRAYLELHDRGVAHSVEVWSKGELAGGLLGIELGGLFCADSKFHRVRDASKVAVAELSRRVFSRRDGPQRLIDLQWLTPHLKSLGGSEMSRPAYLEALVEVQTLSPALGGVASLKRTR